MVLNLAPPQATLLLPYREASPAAFRIGVITPSPQPSPWVEALLAFLRQVPGFDVRSFPLKADPAPAGEDAGWLMDRLYTASRASFDPFGAHPSPAVASPSPESLNAIRTFDCHVILWLAPIQDPGVPLNGLSRRGVLTVRLGEQDSPFPFWDEVAGNSVTSKAAIFWHDNSFAQGRLLRQAETSSFLGLHFTLNAEQPLVAVIRMLASLCLDIQADNGRFERLLESAPLRSPEATSAPSNAQAALFLARKLMRSARLRWNARGKQSQWFVAIRPNRSESIVDPARLNPADFADVPIPKGVEGMADPFLWEAGGSHFLLFEEMAVGWTKGRLACVEILEGGRFSEMQIILDRPYHLSYPCVFAADGESYLLPETEGAKKIELYRFRRFPSELELVLPLIDGFALVDTTPVRVDDRWCLFTTTSEPFMETLLFTASRLDGPYSLHPSSPISTSVRSCRSAGHLFWKDGRLFRPTQDCSVRYGYGMVVNEVTRLTESEFQERPVSYLSPSWRPGLLGTHTWNESSRYQVLDGVRLRDGPSA